MLSAEDYFAAILSLENMHMETISLIKSEIDSIKLKFIYVKSQLNVELVVNKKLETQNNLLREYIKILEKALQDVAREPNIGMAHEIAIGVLFNTGGEE